MTEMNSKLSVSIVSICIMCVFLVPIGPVNAITPSVNLPSTTVTIEVFSGYGSFFDTVLTNVPPGYDVTNKCYRGWCVDRRNTISFSPDTHQVNLYSSLYPPPGLGNEKWNMVNYILNHKQGAAADIQQAMWYFVNLEDGYTPSRTTAKAIVNDTLANGANFVPQVGQVLAIICYTMDTDSQITIIELFLSAGPRLPGDVNNDGTVDIYDAIVLATAFQTKPGKPNWNPDADLNADLIIDIYDAITVAANYGKQA